MLDHIRYAANIEGNTGGATGDHFDKSDFSPLRQGLQHLAISRVLFPKSASEADLPPQSLELDRILRLAA